jgi:integrase/recombinase XerD
MDTIAEVLTALDNYLAAQGRALKTGVTYKFEAARFCHWLIQQQLNPRWLTPVIVQSYMDELAERDLPVSAQRRALFAIKALAKATGQVQAVRSVKIPQQAPIWEQRPRWLTLQEVSELYDRVDAEGNLRDIALVRLLVATGIRPGELADLNDSDLTDGGLRGPMVHVHGKHSRSVPIQNSATAMILHYLRARGVTGPLITGERGGGALSEVSVARVLKHYGVTAQQLRHTYCRHLIAAGTDMRIVSEFTGIADYNVLRRYVMEED